MNHDPDRIFFLENWTAAKWRATDEYKTDNDSLLKYNITRLLLSEGFANPQFFEQDGGLAFYPANKTTRINKG